MKKRVLTALFAAALTVSLAACGQKETETTAVETTAAETEAKETTEAESAETEEAKSEETVKIKIGASITPHAEILNYAKDALKEEGIEIEVMEFTDYVLPNTALEEGSIDANYFQHLPYMDQFNVEKGTHLVSAGAVHYEPFGIFAGTKKDLSEIADGDKIAVPNDTTNEARALLLLEANGLIKLKEGAGLTATKQDIVENPKNLDIVELESAQISRSLSSVAYAVMNGNYAIQAGYAPTDALAVEDEESVGAKTYGNVIAVKEGRENEPWVAKLVEVLHSEDVKNWMTEKYEGAVVPLN
ncbi:MAG: MetQ/NlpA family ABC transporter substrate-binding protein [Eubacteriales bacterium]|nr:MetQ/NlpA family ABC transporter substrate-binding protein [Eubacteriales bacterium]